MLLGHEGFLKVQLLPQPCTRKTRNSGVAQRIIFWADGGCRVLDQEKSRFPVGLCQYPLGQKSSDRRPADPELAGRLALTDLSAENPGL